MPCGTYGRLAVMRLNLPRTFLNKSLCTNVTAVLWAFAFRLATVRAFSETSEAVTARAKGVGPKAAECAMLIAIQPEPVPISKTRAACFFV